MRAGEQVGTQLCLEPVFSHQHAVSSLALPWQSHLALEALQSGPRTCVLRPGPCPGWEYLLRDGLHCAHSCAPTKEMPESQWRGNQWWREERSQSASPARPLCLISSLYFLPWTLLTSNPVIARLCLPPYLLTSSVPEAWHLPTCTPLKLPSARASWPLCSQILCPLVRPLSSWSLSGFWNDDCSLFKLWYNESIII